MAQFRVGIVFHGTAEARISTKLEESRFAGTAKALAELDIEPVAAIYNDDFRDEFFALASSMDGLLVWVNPITEGRDRTILDATLKELANKGVMVSAHPDVILRMGTKQVLYDTRNMAWGSDVRVYHSPSELDEGMKSSLASGKARVLKQYRGHSGGGIWKVQLASPTTTILGDTLLKVRHAERGSTEQIRSFDETYKNVFLPYLGNGGRVIDQEYQERLTDGMIRCYHVIDRIEGFGHQAINALFPAPDGGNHEDAPQPGPRLYYPPDKPEFQKLKRKMEEEWLPEMMQVLGVKREELPLLWDADFFYGSRDANGEDTYVLCEINVSSVSPFPESAERPLAKATLDRLLARTRSK
jgi:hypothetical protein